MLDLSRNQLTGDIQTEFWEQKTGSPVPHLIELYLNDNQLTWSTLPTELGSLTKLERLHLQNNMLSGTLLIGTTPQGTEMATGLEKLAEAIVSFRPVFRELALWGNPGLELSATMSDDLVKRVDRAVLRTALRRRQAVRTGQEERGEGSAFSRILDMVCRPLCSTFTENDPVL